MKSTTILLIAVALSATAGLRAQTVVQTVNFNETATYTDAAGTVEHVDSTFFTGTFNPFDASLGTLDSFVIQWTLANTGAGTLGVSGGSLSLTVSGSLSLNGDIYHGGVVGFQGTGGPPNTPFSLSAPVTATDTFLSSGAGTDYDTAFLTLVTGDSDFTIGYTAPVVFSIVSGSATFDASTIGDVTLTYHYTAAAVPEPATAAALAGFVTLALAASRRRRR
ncbi:MAG: hypothetical protein ABII82_15650 [Verrucomicrobiota bacterium]